ncbi:transcriptional regulator ATRX-like isoform X2 [Mastomys coucha]|uniref:transcriptional regulator ATRX-like isoform X2 n=1 Tax=Mastomys coucha TaxID=35658 RepID=UPI00126229F7|nr:transcriptional regulator ATRX-like isoform X2 [Mastomys coucha]
MTSGNSPPEGPVETSFPPCVLHQCAGSEDIFENLEIPMGAQSSPDYQGDGNNGTELELKNSPLKLKTSSKYSRRNIKSKITAKLSKELYVKLTPISLCNYPRKGADCQEVLQEKDVSKSSSPAPFSEKCGAKEESNEDEQLAENNVPILLEEADLQRSLQVKTKHSSQQVEAKSSISNSDKESNETVKEKQKLSVLVRKKNKQNSATAVDTPTLCKVPKTKQARIVDQSSDSDEMLAVFTELSQMGLSSLDTSSNQIQIIHKIPIGRNTNANRKWKGPTSSSDFGIKKGNPSKISIFSMNKYQNYSESSNSDSDLRREVKNMSKIRTDRVAKKSVLYKNKHDVSKDQKQSEIAVDSKMLDRVNTTHEGPSDDTERSQGRNFFSTAEDPVKKRKNVMELADTLCKRQLRSISLTSTEKPSWREENVKSLEVKTVAKTKKIKHMKIKTCKIVKSGLFAVADKYPRKEQSDESSEEDKQQRIKGTEVQRKKTAYLMEETDKMREQCESSSDGIKSFLEREENVYFLKGIKQNENTIDGVKKGKIIKNKGKEKSPGSGEKLPGKRDRFDSSEDKKNMHRVYGREKKKCSSLENSSRKRPECLSTDNEDNLFKGECCDSPTKRLKTIELRERRNLNSKINVKETQSGLSSSDAEESSEDSKKQKKQRKSAQKQTGNAKEKKQNSLVTISKWMPADITSSSPDNGEDDYSSVSEGRRDEQKIKPLTENVMLPSQIRFCQSSRDDVLPRSVPFIEVNDDSDSDPENRIAKKMLLEEIRASLFMDEDSSSNDES